MIKKSAPVFQQLRENKIDITSGVITDVVIVNEGVDTYGENMDDIFLQQVAALGAAQTQGVKSRFGHPNMCDDALGSYIGRYKNFRVVPQAERSMGDPQGQLMQVVADLHLDPVSKNAPKGDLYTYILEFSKKNSDMFGNSIVFRADFPETRKVKDDSGEEVEKEFIRIKSLVASDLVDSPAATNSLFKSDDDFAAKATEYLDSNPEIIDMIRSKPELLTEFFTKYLSNTTMKTEKKESGILSELSKSMKELKELFKGKQDKEKATINVTTADGTLLEIDDSDDSGKPAVDDPCAIDGKPAPDDDYTMPDGGVISVKDGKITAIKESPATDADPKPAPTPAPEEGDSTVKAMAEENEKLKAKVTDLEAKLAERDVQFKDQNEQIKTITDDVQTLKESIKSTYVPAGRKTKFTRTADEGAEVNRMEIIRDRMKSKKKKINNDEDDE